MSDSQTSEDRTCICADPENCTERVPGYRCKKDFMPRATLRSKERFINGRYEAFFRDGRIYVEFMAGGDEEQFVDMKPEEARAFYEWLGKVVTPPSCTSEPESKS